MKKSFLDSNIVYRGEAYVSPDCDTLITHSYSVADVEAYEYGQPLQYKYTETIVLTSHRLSSYTFTSDSAHKSNDSWPGFLSEQYQYFENGLLESLVRTTVENNRKNSDKLRYKYFKTIPSKYAYSRP